MTTFYIIGLSISYVYYDDYFLPLLERLDDLAANPATDTIAMVLDSKHGDHFKIKNLTASLSDILMYKCILSISYRFLRLVNDTLHTYIFNAFCDLLLHFDST